MSETETPPRYRTLARPGPGLATIVEPDGRVRLWSLNRRATRPMPCARCGALAGRNYRPAVARAGAAPRLCHCCVEGVPSA
jgi:hypothetical protein